MDHNEILLMVSISTFPPKSSDDAGTRKSETNGKPKSKIKPQPLVVTPFLSLNSPQFGHCSFKSYFFKKNYIKSRVIF